MGWWTDRVLPGAIDRELSRPLIAAARERVCAGLHGDVVEIGFGSGLNVPHYPAAVSGVRAIEPSARAWELAAPRIAASSAPVFLAGRDGQSINAPDASADAVLITFTLGTIPDAAAALAEIRRVLRPGGAPCTSSSTACRPIRRSPAGSGDSGPCSDVWRAAAT